MQDIEPHRSAIWGGATLGLVVGAAMGFFNENIVSSTFKGVLVGAALGITAEILGKIGDKLKQ